MLRIILLAEALLNSQVKLLRLSAVSAPLFSTDLVFVTCKLHGCSILQWVHACPALLPTLTKLCFSSHRFSALWGFPDR